MSASDSPPNHEYAQCPDLATCEPHARQWINGVPEENTLRDKALNLIALARNPRLVPSGPKGWAHEDTKSADREAQLALAAAMLALAAAMLDLADALRSTAGRSS